MVVTVKVGRRIHRKRDGNFFTRNLNNARNVVSIQQYMWRTIQYGFSIASKKVDIDNTRKKKRGIPINFTYSKKKYVEEEDVNYNIEWIVVKIESTDEIEEQQHKTSLRFFNEIKNNPVLQKYINSKDGKDIDSDIAKAYNPKNKRIKKMVTAAVDKAGDQSISRFLNEVGIIVFVDKEENILDNNDSIQSVE